jgi:large-conductance mechanosensitive channel
MAERKRKPTKNTAKLATSGSTIRLEQPKSDRKPKKRAAAAKVVVQEINPVEGFVGFLRHYAIIGLSIGFIIGNQMSNLVKIIVASFIDPVSHLLFGTALSQRTFTLRFHDRIALFGWGAVVYGMIQLILLLIFIYIAIKIFNLDKLEQIDKK